MVLVLVTTEGTTRCFQVKEAGWRKISCDATNQRDEHPPPREVYWELQYRRPNMGWSCWSEEYIRSRYIAVAKYYEADWPIMLHEPEPFDAARAIAMREHLVG